MSSKLSIPWFLYFCLIYASSHSSSKLQLPDRDLNVCWLASWLGGGWIHVSHIQATEGKFR